VSHEQEHRRVRVAARILRAYARRIAAGDIEALPSMVLFVSDVDNAMREAVQGLHRFGYTWTDIAARLGVSRQAVVQRYGDPTERDTLDRRLREGGMTVTVALLAQVFADHHPGVPAALTCPGCGYRYPDGVFDCPTNATVRPLLYRRRAEDRRAIARLTPDQYDDLHDRKAARTNRSAARTAPPTVDSAQLALDWTLGGEPR
jgi:hypothetical protein